MTTLFQRGAGNQGHHGMEIGVGTGVNHHRQHFTLLHDSAGIGQFVDFLVDWQGLTGQCRLIQRQVIALQ